jgi:hypothetical protein
MVGPSRILTNHRSPSPMQAILYGCGGCRGVCW